MRPSRSGAIQCASFMAKAQCLPVVLTVQKHADAVIAAAICLSLISSVRRMPSNNSAWCRWLHITGCIQSISLHGRCSRCSVPCACPCTQRRPASRRGRPLHAAHSDAVAVSLPRTSSSTIVPVAIVWRPGPYRAAGLSSITIIGTLIATTGSDQKRCQTEGPCNMVPFGAQPSAAAGGAWLAKTLTRYSVPARCYEPAVPSLSTEDIIMMSLRFSQHSRTWPTASASGLVGFSTGVSCRYRAM